MRGIVLQYLRPESLTICVGGLVSMVAFGLHVEIDGNKAVKNRFYESVVYDDARRKIDQTHSRQLLSIHFSERVH